MSLELHPVQVRLDDDAYDALTKIAIAQDKDRGEVGRELLTRLLLGEIHALRLLAERLTRATTSDSER